MKKLFKTAMLIAFFAIILSCKKNESAAENDYNSTADSTSITVDTIGPGTDSTKVTGAGTTGATGEGSTGSGAAGTQQEGTTNVKTDSTAAGNNNGR
ncbi:hypothetical protein [Flavobacterium tyrosinilyticum]|uniref:hypothetical protein n=1 Tax=Flavobacterium tyrosinilyticum TaxID=1658740 RepID=UPI0020302535|nr:hypothetical protein [Flavobacterium tyrosinilyticum]MCM0667070.1 hypothetical protein [Flavobacterium tyrosinilyticum]